MRTWSCALSRYVVSLRIISGILLALALVGGSYAASPKEDSWRQWFPHADRIGEFEGDPLAATVYEGNRVLGYLFRTDDVYLIPAYSGKPVNQLVGIDNAGTIRGALVLEHSEPILLVGIPESRLDEFTDQYAGKSVRDRIKVGAGKREGYVNVDAITGATVTVMVMNEGLVRAARMVAESRNIITSKADSAASPARVRSEQFEEKDWRFLTGNGAIRRLLLTRGQVDESFVGTPAEHIETAGPDHAGDTFIDLYYAYLNAPTIGRNLLGDFQFNWLMSELKPGEHAIAVLGSGLYSFKGSGYVRGGIFDRILVNHEGGEISFRDLDYHRLSDVYAQGMPEFSELAIFIVRPQHRFDPGAPWRLELLVKRQTGPLDSVFASFGAEYQLPEAYFEKTEPVLVEALEAEPIWKAVWRERSFQIGVLVIGLALLTLIMALQDWLVRFPKLILYLRNGFLIYTVVFIGWYLLGQLSIVNVFTFTSALMGSFSWDTFLIDPTMFILWTFVAGSLLFWGRGVYCGWLCPFGALQKLINEAARYFNVRQFNFPQIVHDRLWGIKYLILLVLFGVSLQSLGSAERYAEIEPFKTAITLRFDREWPFILYAAGLLLVSIFNCKFYCKYVCPLGAALAVPARLRLVDWLRRRKECGNPCQVCSRECEIQAISDTGAINPNECHYCLDCQVIYWDSNKCPPLVEKRKKRARQARGRQKVLDLEQAARQQTGSKDIPVELGERRDT